jgi:hypothetical protein
MSRTNAVGQITRASRVDSRPDAASEHGAPRCVSPSQTGTQKPLEPVAVQTLPFWPAEERTP